jgi:hypothetical protein
MTFKPISGWSLLWRVPLSCLLDAIRAMDARVRGEKARRR